MIFSSLTFLLYFLPAVLLVHFLLPHRAQNAFLLLSSLLFYAWGDIRRVPLFVVLLLADWSIGIALESRPDKSDQVKERTRRRIMLALGLFVNFGALVFYKYAAFLLGIFGWGRGFPVVQSLPLGISFFTFQAAGYLIDVYREQTEPERSLITFGTFIFLFPQLIAGPIIRYGNLKDALHRCRRPDARALEHGMAMFILGLGAKVLLANPLGAAYETLRTVSGDMLCAWLSLIAYSLQLYFDFCGYSTMAMGMGSMLGFEFPRNFNHPYAACSVTDFWHRWHITLSGWFRDYVYIPLGGSRRGNLRTLFNLMVVWSLTGLWHGADWNFLLWGLWYFVLLTIERFCLKSWSAAHPVPARIMTLLCVMLGWALFVSDGLSGFTIYLGELFCLRLSGNTLFWLREYSRLFLIAILCCIPAAASLCIRVYTRHSLIGRGMLLILLILCLAALVQSSYNPFLYFRF